MAVVGQTALSQPVVTSQPTNQVLFPGDTAIFAITVSGRGPLVYQWQFEGTNLPNNVVTTFAGGANASYPALGDGGPALGAHLGNPEGVAVDLAGNAFIGDAYDRVRKVGAGGTITTVAGGGSNGLGDGGAATNAEMEAGGVAVDAAGNLLIADFGNNRIRLVETNGFITTVAGGGGSGLGDGAPAVAAQLSRPVGVAVDGRGNIYIADYGNNRIRKVTYGIISTAAGGGSRGFGDGSPATQAQLDGPTGVAVDAAGDLLIADYGDNCIRRVDGLSAIITTFAGRGKGGGIDGLGDGGPATNAILSGPTGVAVDGAGSLFILDGGHGRIRKVDTNGVITTVAGNGVWTYGGDGGPATNASFWFYNNDHNSGVAVDQAGNLFIADTYDNRVREAGFGGYPTVTVSNVAAANTGRYQVTVSDDSGSVTSSVAVLTVVSPPAVSAISRRADGALSLSVNTTTNISSRLYSATNLTPPVNWQPVYTNPAGGAWQFTDPEAARHPVRFYRLSTP